MDASVRKKANEIFEKFCAKLAQVDMTAAVVVPAAIGVTVAFYGIVAEAHGQTELLKHGGQMALDAYKTAMQQYAATNFSGENDSVFRYVQHAFGGRLPSFGGNMQGVGFGSMFGAPVLSGATVLFAQRFESLRALVSEKLDAFRKTRSDMHERTQAVPVLQTIGGNSLVLANIAATGREPNNDVQMDSDDDLSPSGMRP